MAKNRKNGEHKKCQSENEQTNNWDTNGVEDICTQQSGQKKKKEAHYWILFVEPNWRLQHCT